MMKWPDWFCVDDLFMKANLNTYVGATTFIETIWRLYQDLDYEEIRKEAEARICPEKQMFGRTNKCWPPFGYYCPSEARIMTSTNTVRGSLYKKAKKPTYIYDYDVEGNIRRICQMSQKGKIYMISHCMRERLLELRICSYQNIENISQARYDNSRNEALALILYSKAGGLVYSSYSGFSGLNSIFGGTIRNEVEVYRDKEDNLQGMRYYSFISNSGVDRKCASLVWYDYEMEYDIDGRMISAGRLE